MDLGPTQPFIRWVPGYSQGVKQPGLGADHLPPSSTQVKERAMLLPLWAYVACSRVNFTCTFTGVVICRNVMSVLKEALLYDKSYVYWTMHHLDS